MDLQRRLSSNECDELESVMEAADPSRTGLMQGSLTRLHGFLTSVISGPLVQPSEWLSVVFAETGTWRTKAEADRGYSLVMRFNNEVASDLIEGRFGIMVDCVGEEPDAVEYADDWCLGYWAGTELRRDQWDAALEDDTLATLVRPIIALADLDDAGTFSHDRDPERYRRMLEVLPEFAVRIYDWWRQHDSALPHEPVRRASRKVSPNASCPCGSGKKYKKCCGAP